MPELTVSQLKKLLHYCPKTGIFTWKVSCGTARAGSAAGSPHHTGYRQAKVLGTQYLAHRLAWFYMKGHWPPNQIDHINGVRDDNRLVNLRLATHAVNGKNMKRHCNNTSGTTGVYWNKAAEKWGAYIQVDGKNKHLGLFTNKKEAIRVRREAEKKYGFHANHGLTPKRRAKFKSIKE